MPILMSTLCAMVQPPAAVPRSIPSNVALPSLSTVLDAEAALRTAHNKEAGRVMENLFRPVATERREPSPCHASPLPSDLPRGALLRNGPNARPGWASGGWLDGDGLVHSVCLPPEGSADAAAFYSRAWLRTAGFAKEEAAGQRLFDGSLVAPYGVKLLTGLALNALRAAQPQKDTANTALHVFKGGRVLALMEQCLPCEFAVSVAGRVHTVKASASLDGALIDRAAFPFSGGGALRARTGR